MKKICLNVISYFHEFVIKKNMDIHDFFKEANKLKFEYVEICDKSVTSLDKEYVKGLCKEMDYYGIKPVCMDIRNDFSLKDYMLEKEIEHVKKWLHITKSMGIDLARIWIDRSNNIDNTFIKNVYYALEKVLRVCEEIDVNCVIENHCDFSYDVKKHNSIIEHFNSKYLFNCVDFERIHNDNFECNFTELCRYVKHIHAKSFEFDEYGEEINYNYKLIGNILKNIGYSGYYSIEYEGDLLPKSKYIDMTRNLIIKYFP